VAGRIIMTSGSTVATSIATTDSPPPLRIVISPNCSLTPTTAAVFLAATGGATFLIAVVMAARGLWPILPFAGLEIALLVWATLHSIRRGHDREILEIDENSVRVSRLTGGHTEMTVFPRHWTKVKLRAPQQGLHPARLTLESQGRTCEVGSFLTEGERRSLAGRLKQLIGKV
jgi:uncharacterized membrane protein